MSKQEDRLWGILRGLSPKHLEMVRNYRPDWLKNEKTGHNLEIDIYYPKYVLGFEFQGNQHYFAGQKRRHSVDYTTMNDNLKMDLARKKSKRIYKKAHIVLVFPQDILPNDLEKVKHTLCQRIRNQTPPWKSAKICDKLHQKQRTFAGHGVVKVSDLLDVTKNYQ